LAPYGNHIIRINNPGDPEVVRASLQAAAASETLAIVVADYRER